MRRAVKRKGGDATETPLTPFVRAFCQEYARVGILEVAHGNAELIAREPLDCSGFDVHVEEWDETVKGAKVQCRKTTIYDPVTGAVVKESEIRKARAAQLYHMPEVQAEVRRLRDAEAELVKVTANSLVVRMAQIHDAAMEKGQLQVAANLVAMHAKLFGLDAGAGDAGGNTPAAPVAAVEVRIRDYSGKPADSEG